MRALLLALCAVLLAPAALAQEHGHAGDAGMAFVLRDGPPDGRAVTGSLTHFGFALLDKDGAPVVHQNAEFNVLQGDTVVFSTTDTHEYDGLFSFDVRFTRPGPYLVTAASGDMMLGTFEGIVVEPANATEARIVFDAVPAGPASRNVVFTVDIVDATGARIPHSDAIVEFRDAMDTGSLVTRTHLHIHEDPIVFEQSFGGIDHVAQVIAYNAYPDGASPDFTAVVGEFPFSVGPVAAPALPVVDPAPPALLEQRGASASGDGVTLYAMYDPNNQVGAGQLARISGIVVSDATRAAVQHVDLAFTLSGPRGLVFSSASLHEYDGVFEYAFMPDAPGVYDGELVLKESAELRVPVRLYVVPQVVPLGGPPGVATLSVDGLADAKAGEPVNLTFAAMSNGMPAAHSEVDVTIFRDGEAPLYLFKLHTHDSGLTNALVTFPEEGDWKMRLDGVPTVPEPVVYPATLVEFAVGPAGAPAAVREEEGGERAAEVPSAWVVVTLAALAAGAFARRR